MVTCPPPALPKPICFLPQLSCSEAWDQWPGALSPHPTRTSDVCSPVRIALPRGPPAGPSPSAARLASPCRRGFGLVHRKNAGLFSRLIGRLRPAPREVRYPGSSSNAPQLETKAAHAPRPAGEDAEAPVASGKGARRGLEPAVGLGVPALHPRGVAALSSSLHGAEKKRVCNHDIDTRFRR